MIYYTSPTHQHIIDRIDQGILGSFDSPVSRTRPYRKAAWCADNGCFKDNYVGNEGYLRWLTNASDDAPRCAFATAPDVLMDAKRTLYRSVPMFPKIRKLGYPVALVAQNGLENMAIPWQAFDVLFLGGDIPWKLGPAAASLVAEAKKRGKKIHMGRVNTQRRIRYAYEIGCDSVDGNLLTFGPDRNLPALLSWLEDVHTPGVNCLVCEKRFYPLRLDARTCSVRCRKRLSRQGASLLSTDTFLSLMPSIRSAASS